MDANVKMRATPEWMAAKYDEMNRLLFNGALGPCYFGHFTTGKGSQGRTLGQFRLAGKNLKYNRRDRRIYQQDYWGGKTYVNKNNFYEICKPTIELNGHYTATEESLLATLVHEMCHYYTEMYGYIPAKHHGTDFKRIASIVSYNSNGRFTIQRLATAEEMAGYELDQDMKAINDKRMSNKKSRMMAIAVVNANNTVELTTTSSEDLVREIYNNRINKPTVKKIYLSKDPQLIEKLFSIGFKKSFRTYRYWNVNPIQVKTLGGPYFMENYEHDLLYDNPEYQDDAPNTTTLSIHRPTTTRPPQKKQTFIIRTATRTMEIPFNGSIEELKDRLRETFPKISEENLDRLVQNKANYRITESLRLHKIIMEALNKIMLDNG